MYRMKIKRYHLLLLSVLLVLTACSPKSNYMVLSFFFDGVPDYTKKNAVVAKDTTTQVKHITVTTSLPVPFPNSVVHKPYAERNCDACHEKGVNNRSLKEQPAVCFGCHKNFQEKYKYVHGPVAGGYCTTCHYPHQGELASLLKKQGQKLCLQCHTLTQVMKNPAHSTIGNTDCTSCHNPHGGANRFVLNK